MVERDVGVAQQLATSRSIADGDADAGVDRQRHRRFVELERLAHHVEQPFGDELRRDRHRGTVDQYDELVAAHPSDRVGVAQGAGQSRRDGHQQVVTGLVPEGVVDVLEVVEVDVQRGPDGAVASVASEQLFDAIHDQRPVRQLGQRVVQRLMTQFVGALADQPQSQRPAGAEHQYQSGQHDARGDAGHQDQERTPIGEDPGVDHGREGLDGPSVAQVVGNALGAVAASVRW